MKSKTIIYLAVLLVVAMLGAYSVGRATGALDTRAAVAAQEEQYYRGLYGTCVAFEIIFFAPSQDVAQGQCLNSVSGVYQRGWYAESPVNDGWVWPLPTHQEN